MDQERLKRYQQDQKEFFAELDTARSPEALVQRIADLILETPGPAQAAHQADAAFNLTVTFLRSRGLKPAQAKEFAGVVKKRIEFALWSRDRKNVSH